MENRDQQKKPGQDAAQPNRQQEQQPFGGQRAPNQQQNQQRQDEQRQDQAGREGKQDLNDQDRINKKPAPEGDQIEKR